MPAEGMRAIVKRGSRRYAARTGWAGADAKRISISPLKPMSPAERRIIHTTLAEDGGVSTHSEGEEPDRHVVITPRGTPSGGVPGASGRSHGRFGSRAGNHTRP